MFLIETEKAFLDAFRPRDRKFVEPPRDTRFPLFIRDYLAWVDPSGVRVFLVFSAPGSKQPTGIAFRRDQQGDPASPHMCDWCHLSTGADVGLLTTDVNSKRRVGTNLCLDLRCGERLEAVTNRAGQSVLDSQQKLVARMTRFAREALGIDGNPDA